MNVPVPFGDVIDRLTICRIKAKWASHKDTRGAAADHADQLCVAWMHAQQTQPCDLPEYDVLITINQSLWKVEERLREMEQEERFDQEFIGLARSVYRLNDARAVAKAKIDERLQSPVRDPKSYPLLSEDAE